MSGAGTPSRNRARSRSRSSDLRAEAGRLYHQVYQGNRNNGNPAPASATRSDNTDPGQLVGIRVETEGGIFFEAQQIARECADQVLRVPQVAWLPTHRKVALVQYFAQCLGVVFPQPLVTEAEIRESEADSHSSESEEDIPELEWGQSWAGHEDSWSSSLQEASWDAEDEGQRLGRRWRINS
jgi:hypothetical protein